MKNVMKKAVLVSAIAAGAVGIAQADTFQALLNVISPIGISQDTQMDLGTITAAANGETCVLAASGARTGLACFGTDPGVNGVLDVSGTQGEVFDITVAPATENGMTFTPTVLDNGEGVATLTSVTLQADHELTMGGTLAMVDFTLAAGTTSISYDVSVAYQ